MEVDVEPEQARNVLLAETMQEFGALMLMRLGQDPGASRMKELRIALRALWRHWRSREALPFDIAGPTAMILHFHEDCQRNISEANLARESLLATELRDVEQGAYDLLAAPYADEWVVRRPDLGE
jgi:hypothetical protein